MGPLVVHVWPLGCHVMYSPEVFPPLALVTVVLVGSSGDGIDMFIWCSGVVDGLARVVFLLGLLHWLLRR